MSSNSSPHSLTMILTLLVVVATAFLTSPATATDHIVGANKGWNAGLNYTSWANNQTFFVGDYISFRYKKFEHNVFEVNKTGYENCTTDGSVGNWTNGKDFIQLKKPGRYYFICGNGGCSLGMKVSVDVHALSPPSSAALTEHSAESDKHYNSDAAVLEWFSTLGLFVVLVASLLMGM